MTTPKKPDPRPAFPTGRTSEDGITARLWLAGQALPAVIGMTTIGKHAEVAAEALRYADEVLAADAADTAEADTDTEGDGE